MAEEAKRGVAGEHAITVKAAESVAMNKATPVRGPGSRLEAHIEGQRAFLLVYLNRNTFRDAEGLTAAIVRRAVMHRLTLVLVPSIALVSQSYREWERWRRGRRRPQRL